MAQRPFRACLPPGVNTSSCNVDSGPNKKPVLEWTPPPGRSLLITSDLHLGSPYSRVTAFRDLLQALPDTVDLLLNGDTFDRPETPLPPDHEAIVELLAHQCRRRRVLVLAGNHDGDYASRVLEGAETATELLVPDRLFALHGDAIDTVLPTHDIFIRWFRRFHQFRVRLGARDIHVAEYAKRWPLAYRILVKHQRGNAARLAMERGVPAITCGHVHFPEEVRLNGITYLNTGAWTEAPVYCVLLDREGIRFCDAARLAAASWPDSTTDLPGEK